MTLMHEPFMRHCLELAERGRGNVGNGAMVGAVLVREGNILAEGFHEAFGQAHAERHLLENYADTIEPDDMLYANLEPCCHQGKTPPCTDIITERGIKTVVYGMRDPDSRVSGKGVERLREAGVTVIGPILQPLCERFNRGFVSVRTKGRPYITLKKAQTRDGRIANGDGSPLAITSDEQNRWSHTHLRAEHDAILVGIGTARNDDPHLDARLDERKRDFHPWRIILDARLHVPLGARVVSDEYCHRTIIVHGPGSTNDELRARGVRLFEVPIVESVFDWDRLWHVLTTPKDDYHGLGSILVEGGQKTWQLFRDAGMVDEEVTLTGE